MALKIGPLSPRHGVVERSWVWQTICQTRLPNFVVPRRSRKTWMQLFLEGSGPPGAFKRSFAFSLVNRFCMGLLYGRAGRLTAKNGGFRSGQVREAAGAGLGGHAEALHEGRQALPQADGQRGEFGAVQCCFERFRTAEPRSELR
jgi:hypothetical protein